ncbi:hypothetical protein F4803DRAFT_439516 [Xylaria telfairii]|nr:hypothetical protein F4803DRAFT_439516 [Xylaria telfairii]
MAANAQGLASWDAALQPYLDRLSSDNLSKLKQSTTLEEFLDEFKKFGHGSRNASRGGKHESFWKVMNEILHPLVRFSTAIDVVAQINATIGCSIWGPLKLVVQICYEHKELLEHVSRIISMMGENVKRVNQYDVLFGTNDMVKTAARLLYSDYINFCTMVIQYGDKSRAGQLLTSFENFKEVYAAMMEHEKRLDAAAMAAFMCDNMAALSTQIQDQQRKKQQEILKWIGDPPDYEKRLQQLRSERLQNSCDWVLRLCHLHWWRDTFTMIQWLHGGPGCGKTTLASSVIDHRVTDSSFAGCKVLYAFCSNDGRSSLAVLRSLMHQLLLNQESLFGEVMEDLFHREGKRPVSSFYRLLPMFLACLARSSPAYIIIDGADELDDDCITDLGGGLRMWDDEIPVSQVRLMLLSRSDERIENALKLSYGRLRSWIRQLKLTDEMLAASSHPYILKFVENGVKSSKSLQAAEADGCGVIHSICEAADGHWLYARLLLEEAKRQPTLGRLKSRLQALPKGINNLYTRILREREREFEDDDLKLAKTIYAWVCLARAPRQMTTHEIGILLSLKHGSTVICSDDIPLDPATLITRLCSPLVEIDDLGYVNATHSSVREYFQQVSRKKDGEDKPQVVGNLFETSLSLAIAAATYISLDDSQKSFHTAVSLGGCATELDRTIPLLSQVALPLWDC